MVFHADALALLYRITKFYNIIIIIILYNEIIENVHLCLGSRFNTFRNTKSSVESEDRQAVRFHIFFLYHIYMTFMFHTPLLFNLTFFLSVCMFVSLCVWFGFSFNIKGHSEFKIQLAILWTICPTPVLLFDSLFYVKYQKVQFRPLQKKITATQQKCRCF